MTLDVVTIVTYQRIMNAQECRTLTTTCMHDARVTACVCLFNIRSIEVYTLHLNRVLVLFSFESVHDPGEGGGTSVTCPSEPLTVYTVTALSKDQQSTGLCS